MDFRLDFVSFSIAVLPLFRMEEEKKTSANKIHLVYVRIMTCIKRGRCLANNATMVECLDQSGCGVCVKQKIVYENTGKA